MKTTRVNEIDFMRFFAALAVVLFHYAFRGFAADEMTIMPYPLLAPIAKYGYLGVYLFFMISGFVILMTASRGGLKDFMVSRFIRLYPAFWACCTLTFITILAIGGNHFSASAGQYLINMTMLSEFFNVESIDGVYWSLFVEMRFYALIAIILVLRRIHQAPFFLMLWLVVSIGLEIFPIGKARYFLIVDSSALFIAGAAYFLIWSQGFSWTRIGIVIASLLLALRQSNHELIALEKNYHTNLSSLIVAGVIIAFFAAFLLVALRKTGFLGRQQWLIIGALTYPLYLLHQNIGFMIFNIAYPSINPHVLLAGTILLMLALAYLVHSLVEKPLSRLLKRGIEKNLHKYFAKTT
jgi:peptidoglycan/LPS O-acetylase OafA/YrhL